MCSLFDSPGVFHNFKPELVLKVYKDLTQHSDEGGELEHSKPVTELRVVVQRVFINLPNTSKDSVVGVHSRGTECCSDSDELITCSSCGICVHRCE